MSSTAINPLWSAADPVDRVDHPGRGGDASRLGDVEQRVGDMCVELDAWVPLDHDAVDTRLAVGRILPVGRRGRGEARDVFHGDHRNPVAHSLDREADRGHLAGLDRRHLALDPLVGVPRLYALPNLVEFHAELVGEIAHRTAPHRGEDARQEEHRRVLIGTHTETHRLAGELVVVVVGVVEDLLDGHRRGAGDQTQCGVDLGVARVAGVDAVHIQRRVARLAGLFQWLPQPVVRLTGRHQPHHRRRRDVDARGEELRHLLEGFHRPCLTLRGVDDAIRLERNQCVDVVGRDYAGRLFQPAQLGRVSPDLVRTGGVHTHQLQVRASDDGAQRMLADVAGGKLDYSSHFDVRSRSVVRNGQRRVVGVNAAVHMEDRVCGVAVARGQIDAEPAEILDVAEPVQRCRLVHLLQ